MSTTNSNNKQVTEQVTFDLSDAEIAELGQICTVIAKQNFIRYFNEHRDLTRLASECTADGFMAGMAFMVKRLPATLTANVLDKPQQEE